MNQVTPDKLVAGIENLRAAIRAAVLWAYCPDAGGYKDGRSIEDICEELQRAIIVYTGVELKPGEWVREEDITKLFPGIFDGQETQY